MGKAGLIIIPLLVALSTLGASIIDIYIASRYRVVLYRVYM